MTCGCIGREHWTFPSTPLEGEHPYRIGYPSAPQLGRSRIPPPRRRAAALRRVRTDWHTSQLDPARRARPPRRPRSRQYAPPSPAYLPLSRGGLRLAPETPRLWRRYLAEAHPARSLMVAGRHVSQLCRRHPENRLRQRTRSSRPAKPIRRGGGDLASCTGDGRYARLVARPLQRRKRTFLNSPGGVQHDDAAFTREGGPCRGS